MAGYTTLNLKEVEDQAPNFGLAPDLEARMARVPLELEHFGLSYQRIAPNFRLPFAHKHKNQEEAYIVVSGSMRAKVGDDVIELGQWDVLRVDKDTVRTFEGGPGGAEVLAVGAPNTGPGDAETIQDWWSD
ncbi:MAG: cupin domain-containing protein [Actinobacteria bacterium]|nr:MAG: cupin domain-containing protein [Actinomycetota bacterium]TMM10356.1 MAG: cupin domain-containing protein [Actinomycetota bacterium]